MGVRIRKKWDLLSEQSVALAVLSTAFLLGGGLGCLVTALAGEDGRAELGSYLTRYLSLAREGQLPRELWPLLWGQLKYALLALVLSLTALGVVGLPVLFGVRGFFFSFSVACFCRVFGGQGLFPAFVLFGLSALLWASALFMVGIPGLLSARQQLRRALGDGRGGWSVGAAYWCRAGACVGLSLAAGLLEYWVVPVLLRGLVRTML